MVSAGDESRVAKNNVQSAKSKSISNIVAAAGTTKDEPLKHKKKADTDKKSTAVAA